MSIPEKYRGKYFYHFTHIDNLESIVKNGFLCTNEKDKLNLTHKNIALESIQNRRSEMNVTCKPFGKVHDYVPFYFASTNPILLSITNRKNIDQPFLIFFVVSINKIMEEDVVFTDASANTSEPPNFYNDPKDLDKLDWESIDSKKWGTESEEIKHKRMAEVLVHKVVPLSWIHCIIVWNTSFRDETIRIFKDNSVTPPTVTYSPFNRRHFYFTKFQLNRDTETLVTGPYFLKSAFEKTIKDINASRANEKRLSYPFKNITTAIQKLEKDFCAIKELEGIFKLKTDNRIHKDVVSDHTKKVVLNLVNTTYYNELSEDDKNIVKLAAYLHDIGKGPKSKWQDEIQLVYPDHPADALPMIKRILIEDFEELSKYQIRKICLVVSYHDLIGDILERGRSKQELIDLDIDENELNMLVSITLADTEAINPFWKLSIDSKLSTFIHDILKEISEG